MTKVPKHITLSVCLLFLVLGAWAQQTTLQSLHMFNPYSYNPGYVGMDGSPIINASFRKQWVGLGGSPIGQQVNFHLPLNIIGGGAGIQIENDQLGALGIITTSLGYGYHLPVGKKAKLSMGATFSLSQVSLDGNRLRTPEGNYNGVQVDHRDNTLSNSSKSTFAPDASVGLAFKWEGLNIGFSATRLFGATSSFNNGSLSSQVTFRRNFHALLSYKIPISKDFSLSPSAFARFDGIYVQPEFSIIANSQEKIFGGVSYRGYDEATSDALVLIFGFRFAKNFTLSYAYDYTLSKLNSVNNGSHELLLSYKFNKNIGIGKAPKVIYNPRML